MLGITTTNARVGGFRGGVSAEAKTIYNRIIADGGVSNLTRLNFFVKGLKAIYGDLANVPVCYDAHWIGYKLGSGTGATAGQAAAKLYSLTVAADAVQSTAASQPLLLAHNGVDNYWWGSGVSGNYVSTPNAAANQITGDIEIIAKIDYKNNATFQWITTKISTGTTISYSFSIDNSNSLRADFGAINVISTVSIGASYNGFVKMTRSTSSGDVKFYTSSDDITYTQLGSTRTTTAGDLTTGSGVVNLGTIIGTALNFQGRIYRATISNSIGGAPVVDFNPATYNASTSQTAWTSSTGEVWTINTGTAASGYKGVLVDRTIVQGDGVDDSVRSGAVASFTNISSYVSAKIFTSAGASRHVGGSLSANDHILFGLGASPAAYNGAQLSFLSAEVNKLKLYTTNYNGGSSTILTNNANSVSGNLGTLNSERLILFADGNQAQNGNSCINTLIYSTLDASKNTATYEFLRSLNNNAF